MALAREPNSHAARLLFSKAHSVALLHDSVARLDRARASSALKRGGDNVSISVVFLEAVAFPGFPTAVAPQCREPPPP